MRRKKKLNKLEMVKISRREKAAIQEAKRAAKSGGFSDASASVQSAPTRLKTSVPIADKSRAVEPRAVEQIVARLATLDAASVTRADVVEAARILKSASSKKRERKTAAVVMSKTGGSKRGGENRARKLTPEQRREIARLGGLARQQKAREEDERLGFTKPRNKVLTRREIGLMARKKTVA